MSDPSKLRLLRPGHRGVSPGAAPLAFLVLAGWATIAGCHGGTPVVFNVKAFAGKPLATVEQTLGTPTKRGADLGELKNAIDNEYKPPKGVHRLEVIYDAAHKMAGWIKVTFTKSTLTETQAVASLGLDITGASKDRALANATYQTYFDKFPALPKTCLPVTALDIQAEPDPPLPFHPFHVKNEVPPTVSAWKYTINVYTG